MKRRELVTILVPKGLSEEDATYEILNLIKIKKIKVHVKQKKILDDNNRKLYSLLWAKCTDNMKADIKSSTKYQNMEDDQNDITLLNNVTTNILVICKGHRKIPTFYTPTYIYIYQNLCHTYVRTILLQILILLHVQKT